LLFIGLPAFADPVVYTADLSGPAEFPPNASPGGGFTTVIIDTTAHTLSVDISFQDLVGDPTSFSPSFLNNNGGGTAAGAEAALAAGLDAGRAYLNIHSNIYPGGEIRGFLVPEPGSFILMGTGVLALALLRRRLHATRG
jgi:hypothetical protein